MASIDFMKLHLPQDVKRTLRHCDRDYRLIDNHANPDIDKSRTFLNGQSFDYPTACKRYDDRIEELDSVEGANKRKDRVTAFSLDIPIVHGISDEESYADDICDIIENAVGSENVVCEYVHFDEIHDYIDSETGEKKTSLAHLHIIVVPEIDGKLNGKAFSSRKNMKALNAAVDKMTREKYNVPFLTGKSCTIYYGSKASDIYMRCYDKKIERDREDVDYWVRWEIVLKNNNAKEFLTEWFTGFPIGDLFCKLINHYIRYIVPDAQQKNISRLKTARWWERFIDTVGEIKIYTPKPTAYNIYRCEDYVYRQAGNAVAALIDIRGVDRFLRDLTINKAPTNAKYQQIRNDCGTATDNILHFLQERGALS